MKQECQSLVDSTGTQLNRLLDDFNQQLIIYKSLLPVDMTVEYLKSTIKEAVREAAVVPIIDFYKAFTARESEFTEILTPLVEILQKFQKAIKYILDPLSILEPITQAINRVKEKLLGFDLTFLKDEIGSSVQAVKDKINELDISVITAPLDTIFNNLKTEISGIISTEMINAIDAIYTEKIAGHITNLNLPDLLEPLDLFFEDLLTALKPFSMEELLKPVKDVIDKLEKELNAGLQKTGQAFNNMVKSIPV